MASGRFFGHLWLGPEDVDTATLDRYSDGLPVVCIGDLAISAPSGSLAEVLRALADRVEAFERKG